MSSFQGLYKLENPHHGFIGHAEVTSVVKVKDISEHGIASLAQDKRLMQYYIGEKDGKLFARPPGGFEPQTWFITKNMATENNSNYMIVKSDDYSPWQLSDSKAGTQVGCKVPPPQPASHINENGLWNFIPVTNLMGGQTLETGRYSIRNVANGPINQHDPPNQEVWKDAPVTSSPDLTSWGITKIEGSKDQYQVTFLGETHYNGRPANGMNEKLYLPEAAVQADTWFIKPLAGKPDYYTVSGQLEGGYWQLESNKAGTQVTFARNVASDSLGDDCLWIITPLNQLNDG